MRTVDFNRLARRELLPLLPGFELSKGMLFEKPVAELLRAYTFQGSSFDPAAFFLVCFVQPLYVPSDELMPSFSERSPRFRNLDRLDDVRAFVLGPAHSFLDRNRSPADLAEWIRDTEAGHEPDPFALEALAYSLLLAGRAGIEVQHALELAREIGLAAIRADRDEALYTADEEHPVEDVVDRVVAIRDVFDAGPAKALAALDNWRVLTAGHLGISRYLAPVTR